MADFPTNVLPRAMASLSEEELDAILRDRTGRTALTRSISMLNQRPDTAPLQDYARGRQDLSQMGMLNALAAQYAGEDFSPIQKHFLDRSASDAEAQKFGDYGYVSGGKFVENPFQANEQIAGQLFDVGKQDASSYRAEQAQIAADSRAAANQAAQDRRYFAGLDLRDKAASEKQAAADRKQAEVERKQREVARQRTAGAELVMGKVDEALNNVGLTTAGFIGKKSAEWLPGFGAYALDKTLDTIRANLGFEQLAAMRAASPTGGALGQVTERELALLQSTVANLDNGLPRDVLRQNLEQVKKHYANVKMLMQGQLPPDYQQGAQGNAGSAPPPGAVRRRGQ